MPASSAAWSTDCPSRARTVRPSIVSCIIPSPRYNELCRAGRDDDFGKEAKLLRPLEGCLFLQPVEIRGNGFTMATVGGLVTDDEQNVLNQAYEPIPGLYATGNCCGRRFGAQYSTPISGISIGIAITLGRTVGLHTARG